MVSGKSFKNYILKLEYFSLEEGSGSFLLMPKRYSHSRVPSFLCNRPNVALPLFSRVQNFRGYIYRGNTLGWAGAHYTLSHFLQSDGNAAHDRKTNIAEKPWHFTCRVRIDSPPCTTNARPFDTLVRKYRRRQSSDLGRGWEKEWLFGVIHGLISMNSELHATTSRAAHGAARHPRARIRTRRASSNRLQACSKSLLAVLSALILRKLARLLKY